MKSLWLKLVSLELTQEFEVRYLSLDDSLGRLGIQPDHQPFLTSLSRSVAYFDDLDLERHYLAHDTGILRVESGSKVFLIARIILLGKSLVDLQAELEQRVQKAEFNSTLMRENLNNLQKMLLKQLMEANYSPFGSNL